MSLRLINLQKIVLSFFLSWLLFYNSIVQAAPSTITLQARIIKPDGTALEASSVNFTFTTLSSTGTCILYVEQFSNVNMTSSAGLAVINLGSTGSPTYTGATTAYSSVFDNSASLNCQGGATYTPSTTDRRRLVIQFNDGSGTQTLPAITVNSVPYAIYASSADTLSGKTVSDFVLKSALSDCATAGKVLTFNGTAFSCVSPSASSGTVTNVTSANTDMAVTNNSTTPILTLNTGTSANQILKLDSSAKIPAVDGSQVTNLDPTKLSAAVAINKGGTGATTASAAINNLLPTQTSNAGKVLQTDGTNVSWVAASAGTVTSVTGTAPISVATGTLTPVISIANGTAAGQTLRWDGASAWAKTKLQYTDLVNNTAASPWPASSCTSGQAITWSSISDTFSCTTISLSASNFSSQTANTFLAAPNGSAGAPTFRTIALADLPTGLATQWTTSGSDIYYNTGKVGIGTASPSLPLEIVGAVASSYYATGATANSNFVLRRGRGSSGTPSAIQSGDQIGNFGFQGYTGSAWSTASGTLPGMNAVASENFTSTANGTDLLFLTTPIGSVAATEKLRITESGNVGIGTTTPAKLLDVSGTDSNSNQIWIRNLNSSTNRYPGIVAQNFMGTAGLGGFPAINVNNSRGSSSSPTPIQSGDILGAVVAGGNSDTTLTYSNAALISFLATGNYTTTNTPSAISFATTPSGSTVSAERMRIDSTGNVGIGTTSPLVNLSIAAAAGTPATSGTSQPNANLRLMTNSGNTSVIDMGIYDAAPYGGWIQAVNSGNLASNYPLALQPNGGDVGIGTTTPTTTLDVTGTIRSRGNVEVAAGSSIGFNKNTSTGASYDGTAYNWAISEESSTPNGLVFKAYFIGGADAGQIFYLHPNGSVGIGTSAPNAKLDVQGGVVNSSGGYTQTSDIRLKTNVDYIRSDEALRKIASLRGIYYDWKDQSKYGTEHQIGLIAQDVQKVFPEAVKQNQEGLLSVSYSNLVAPVIEAVKELFKISEKQSREIASKADQAAVDLKVKQLEAEIKLKNQEIESIKKKAAEQEQQSLVIKQYLCRKDPQFSICK